MNTLKQPCMPKIPEIFPDGILQGIAPPARKLTRLEVEYFECPTLPVNVKILDEVAFSEASPIPAAQRTALVICPADRPAVEALAEREPLVNATILGKALIEYWLEHLAILGVRQILVLASDRPERVRARIGDGARWGLEVTVLPETRELSPAEARAKYGPNNVVGDDPARRESPNSLENNQLETPHVVCYNTLNAPGWPSEHGDAVVLDHLPGLPQYNLFDSYAAWFTASRAWMLLLPTSNRIGLREAEPGVWVGLRTHVSPGARLRPPCWLGANVHVGPGANIGPCAIVEDGVLVEEGSEISYTAIAPDTFVGKLTHLEHSLALGQTLIDWRDGSRLEVPDPFLLCSLREPRSAASQPDALGRPAAWLAMLPRLLLAWFLIWRARRREMYSMASSGQWLKEQN
jgi:hypothetical protein